MDRIETSSAPEAIGPYSQATSAGEYVFVSGQIPIDPATGKVTEGGIKEQTSLVIANIENILREVGLGLESVVKAEVFIKNMDDFSAINEAYAEKFTGSILPARQVVEVSRLPKDVGIEISCIAYKGK